MEVLLLHKLQLIMYFVTTFSFILTTLFAFQVCTSFVEIAPSTHLYTDMK